MTRIRHDAPPRTAYSVPEVATSLGVSKSHVYRLCATGQMPSVKIGERVVIPVPAFEAYLAAFPHTPA